MKRIGGTDVAALAGLSKWKSPMDVYLRIVDGAEQEWSPAMERGTATEPLLRAYAQRQLGVTLEDSASDVHVHPDVDFAHAQVDDIGVWNGSPCVLEYKSVGPWSRGWGSPDTDLIPEHYRAQVTWELSCANRDLGLLVAGFGADNGTGFELSNINRYVIERDYSFESFLLAIAGEFWREHIQPRIPPNCKALGKYHALKEAV